jgi:hypothetical protein
MVLRMTCAAAIVAGFLGSAGAQQSPEKPTPSCTFTELYRQEGWTIPGVKGAKKKARWSVPYEPGVYATTLIPENRRARFETFACSRELPGRLEVAGTDIGIHLLYSFEVDGRVFAYELQYGIDVVENGKSMPSSALWGLKFYDMDGSGLFTVRRGERSLFPEFIPDWVKHTNGKPQ